MVSPFSANVHRPRSCLPPAPQDGTQTLYKERGLRGPKVKSCTEKETWTLPPVGGRSCHPRRGGMPRAPSWAGWADGRLCAVVPQSCVLEHGRPPPTLQPFTDLDEVPPGPRDAAGTNHGPLSHLGARRLPCSRRPGRPHSAN